MSRAASDFNSFGSELVGSQSTDFKQLAKDYVSLTKPGVISLLLFSTCCPMLIASQGNVSFSLVLWALLGGALISGSASAINCIWDRDIDSVMSRTKSRPMAAGRLGLASAFTFSLLLGLVGLYILGEKLNLVAASISLFGHFFYVFVYTIWLKRSTPQNIVIGGAAGAVPPMVGWAAITGGVDFTSFLLFLVVFLWTPPHFWALALNKNKDYQKAGVPMLPVVAGEAVTINQMVWYTLSLVPACLLLVWSFEPLGWLSYVLLSFLNAIFLWKVIILKRRNASGERELQEKASWSVFAFSIFYLALFFGILVIDALWVTY